MSPDTAWAGQFGNEYTARNRVDWRARKGLWSAIMSITGARSVLEVGCNAGWNLTAIKEVAPWAAVTGIDINQQAIRQACTAGLDAWLQTIQNRADLNGGGYELVFTAGVLIHTPPHALDELMRDIIRASNHYVLAIEYHADEFKAIDYRGRGDMLWKRPFGSMYEKLGLRRVPVHLEAGTDQGFDNCTVYLMEKP